MLIIFYCTNCESKLEIEAKSAGSHVKCPRCETLLTVPRKGIEPGTTIGGFRIERLLGRGGMGEVYLAKQLSLDRLAALKILPTHLSPQKDMADRFINEIHVLASLQHPNIVPAFEAGEDSGVLFLAMAYVNGSSVEERLRDGRKLAEPEAITIAMKLASALDYAWEKHRVLHRDIKPSNILIDRKGEPMLVDLGLAKSLAHTSITVTVANEVFGTPNYMSPERADGRQEIDCRSDMYSLGATLYHMLTGQTPFRANSAMETLRKQAVEPLADPRTFTPKLSDATVALLEILLARKPEDRYPDWGPLVQDFERVLRGHRPAHPELKPGMSVMARKSRLHGHPLVGSLEKYAPATVVTLGALLVIAVVLAHSRFRRPDTRRTGTRPVASVHDSDKLPVLPPPPGVTGLPPSPPRASSNALARTGEPSTRSDASPTRREPAGQRVETAQTAPPSAQEAQHPGAADAQAPAQAQAAEGQAAAPPDEAERLAAAQRRFEEVVDSLAALLLDGDSTAALKSVRDAQKEPVLGLVSNDIQSVHRLLQRVVAMPTIVVSAFDADKGKETSIEFKDGRTETRIVIAADGGVVKTRQPVSQGFVQHDIAFADLSTREKWRRLGDASLPEFTVMRGLLAMEAGSWDKAALHFAEASDALSAALSRVLRDRTRARQENMAGQFVVRILDMIGCREDGQTPQAAAEKIASRPYSLAEVHRIQAAVKEFTAKHGGTDVARANTNVLAVFEALAGVAGLLAAAGVNPAVSDPNALSGMVDAKVFPSNQVVRIRSDLRDFSLRYGSTPVARAYLPVLSALGSVGADPPMPVLPMQPATQENLDRAITGLRAANPAMSPDPLPSGLEGHGIVLDLRGRNLRGIESLAALPISQLDLSDTSVGDLRPLCGMPLQKLLLAGAPVADLRPLAHAALRELNAARTHVMDVAPLQAIRSLESLDLSDTPVKDLSGLHGLMLRRLSLAGCAVTDIQPLAGMPLKDLDLRGTGVADIRSLAGMPLETLDISATLVQDLAPLSGMPLRALRINHTQVKRLQSLQGLPLQHLSIRGCGSLTDRDELPGYLPSLSDLGIDEALASPDFVRRFSRLKTLHFGDGKSKPADDIKGAARAE